MIVPFLIIYLFNWVVFIIIIVSFLQKTFQSDIKTKNNNNIKFVRQQLSIAVTLSIMFGLGWDIGLLATQDIHTNKTVQDLFAALFVIITAFHGLVIFIMHYLCSEQVTITWKQWFSSMVLIELAEVCFIMNIVSLSLSLHWVCFIFLVESNVSSNVKI